MAEDERPIVNVYEEDENGNERLVTREMNDEEYAQHKEDVKAHEETMAAQEQARAEAPLPASVVVEAAVAAALATHPGLSKEHRNDAAGRARREAQAVVDKHLEDSAV
jgi:hypothetical protein